MNAIFRDMRIYQEEVNQEIHNELMQSPQCIIKMFCGTGKSLIMRRCSILNNLQLIVYVFPSLALISQFHQDYLRIGSNNCDPRDQISSDDQLLVISCESTTNPEEIKHFVAHPLNSNYKKYILVTYQSYNLLLDNLYGTLIDAVIFDEAHHTVSPNWSKLVYEQTPQLCRYRLFFTATPRNERNITMYDRIAPPDHVGNCGRLVYDYSYMRGLDDEYLNAFEVRADCYVNDDIISVFKCIARAIIETRNTRVLTFHSNVNEARDKSVTAFVKAAKERKKFQTIFTSVLSEFPGQSKFWAGGKITVISLDATVKPNDRTQILQALDETNGNNIYILASCQTIGEGIDTKRANMVVFVDPKTSPVQITQNIGRIVRKPEPDMEPATVLLPVWIDYMKYADLADDPVARNIALREDMDNNDTGNFNPILNVIAAIRSEDPEIADICLNYPTQFSPKEIKRHLHKNNTTIGEPFGDGSAKSTLEHLLNIPISSNNDIETPTELFERVAIQTDKCIEVHTNNIDNSVVTFNETSIQNGIVRILKDENGIFLPIISNKSPENKKRIPKMNKKNRPKFSAKCDKDMDVLWKLGGNLTDFTRSLVLECEAIPRYNVWRAKLAQVDEYIASNGKRPSKSDKDPAVKTLGNWIGHQQKNYKASTEIMSNQDIRSEWEHFVDKYKEHFLSNEEEWMAKLAQVDEYIASNGKRPSTHAKDPDVRTLGAWIGNQQKNYKASTQIMLNQDIRSEWEHFVEKYKEHFLSNEEEWMATLAQVDAYIASNGKRPSKNDKDPAVKKLGTWIGNQQKNYKASTEIMSNQDIRSEWEHFVDKYKEHFLSNEEEWRTKLAQVDAYIASNGKRPPACGKDHAVKTLGHWIGHQQENYKASTYIMSNQDIRSEWEHFVDKYKEHFLSNEEEWMAKLAQADEYIASNGKRPSTHAKDPDVKTLGNWIGHQQKNYKASTEIMSNQDIRSEWEHFVDKYKEHFLSNEEEWMATLAQVDAYIASNGKRPSDKAKDPAVKKLGKWIGHQQENYKASNKIMSNQYICSEWEHFVDKYKEHFLSNEEEWRAKLAQVDAYIASNGKRPYETAKDPAVKTLGVWIATQRHTYKASTYIMSNQDIRSEWEHFVDKYKEHFLSNEEEWMAKLAQVDAYIASNGKRPSTIDKDPAVKPLGTWISTQTRNYKASRYIMSNQDIRSEWEHFTQIKYPQYFKNMDVSPPSTPKSVDSEPSTPKSVDSEPSTPKSVDSEPSTPKSVDSEPSTPKSVDSEPSTPKSVDSEPSTPKSVQSEPSIVVKPESIVAKKKKSVALKTVEVSKPRKETVEERRVRMKTAISVLHQKYKTMTSTNLSNMFKSDPELWITYHEISEENEAGFAPESLPRNRVISELSKINTKRPKVVVDMGCGLAHIAAHFNGDPRFVFHNYDHMSVASDIIECDISHLPLEDNTVDYCILSLAMWGSNCKEYLAEAYRILDSTRRLYIIEPTKRWSELSASGEVIKGSEGVRLREMLVSEGFKVDSQYIDKFCMFVCSRSE